MTTEDLSPGKLSVIHIQSVQAGDFGIYNCSVENGYGHDFKTITFYKQGVYGFLILGCSINNNYGAYGFLACGEALTQNKVDTGFSVDTSVT